MAEGDTQRDVAGGAPSVEGYELVHELGRGRTGVVWLARQVSLGRLVALRVLRHDLGLDPEVVERFSRDVRAVAALTHPGIVPVHDFGHSRGLLCWPPPTCPGEAWRRG